MRRFIRDEAGAVLIYVAMALPVIIGFSLLAVDAARLYGLNNSLQEAADAMALAGAAELDRRDDALTRADRALANLVENRQRFGQGAAAITSASVTRRFLKSLPADDKDPVTSAYETSKPDEARFLEVQVKPVDLGTIFPASFVGSVAQAKTAASAVAGMDAAVCQFTPLFMCNPFEGSGTTIYQAAADPAYRRKLLELKRSPGTSSGKNSQTDALQLPGNFGFLDPDASSADCKGGTGAKDIRDALAATNPASCFIRNGVCMKTGNINSAVDYVNQRFDIYASGIKVKQPPAQNVRKGYDAGKKGDWCKAAAANDAVKFPFLFKDTCFATNSCTNLGGGGRIGNGQWDFLNYWSRTQGTTPPNGWNNTTNIPSRYDVYRYEIDNNLLAKASSGGEQGAPQCNGAAAVSKPDRRILYGAVLNCVEDGPIKGASGGPYPVEAFAKFFMTEPMASVGNDDSIYVELVDLVQPGGADNEVARDIVQLYR